MQFPEFLTYTQITNPRGTFLRVLQTFRILLLEGPRKPKKGKTVQNTPTLCPGRIHSVSLC